MPVLSGRYTADSEAASSSNLPIDQELSEYDSDQGPQAENSS